MAFSARREALIGQLGGAIWKRFEIYEIMAFIALLMALMGPLELVMWNWFRIYELMVSTLPSKVLTGWTCRCVSRSEYSLYSCSWHCLVVRMIRKDIALC